MFNIRLSSVLYPTQLHRHDTCARASARARALCAHTIVSILSSHPTHALWWSAHVLRMILRGWSWRWSFLQVTKNPGAVVASLPRRQADSQLHHCTEDINLHHQHLTKKGICRQEVSRISNGCSLSWDRTYTRHVFPATGIGSRAHTQTHTHGLNSSAPHLVLHDITAPCEPEWQAVCLFSSSRRSLFPVLPLF